VTDEPIANTKFKVQRTEGETIGEFLTDENGKIVLSPATGYLLEEAVYTVTEIVPPNGYLLSETNSKQVMLKWYEQTDLIFKNLLKPTLLFIKRDGLSGRGISGAAYKVEYEDANGGTVTLGTHKTKCGIIALPYVQPGWYVLTETIPAPGYALPTNPVQRTYLAPGQNSYTYQQTHEDLYVDARTNPNSGQRGMCGDWCGYLCSDLCADNCGNAGGGSMSGGTGGGFGNITITNGNGEPIGNTVGGTQPSNAPALTAGTVTRVSNMTAAITFTSSAAGKYFHTVVNSGAAEPVVATGGVGTNCNAGANTITVYMTSGAKDVYIKVKDAAGNVSNALKISVPAFVETPTPTPTPTPEPTDDTPNPNGGIIWQNPDFPGIIIKIGNY
jgi:hypothetical protein